MEKTSSTLGTAPHLIITQLLLTIIVIVLMGTHYQWRYPTPGDSVEREQLLSVKPTGDWQRLPQ